ncbi:MAG TPA: PilZ domain-containing protein [Vicinamibacterales bacterium]|jgi:hypothetical protein
MPDARLILIAAPELIPALRERVGDQDVQTFADSEPLRALEAIVSLRPAVVALERLFAASPRGAALIARIKADPALEASEIRVLSHDTDYQRVSPRRKKVREAAPAVKPQPPATLDRGTRRAPRFRMRSEAQLTIDGQAARLIDLSLFGAQVLSSAVLKPGQSVALKMGPEEAPIGASGKIVWARLELSRTGPTYRAGIEFEEPDQGAVGTFSDIYRIA